MTKIKQFIKKYEKMPVVARASLWFVICGFMTRGVSLLTTPIFITAVDNRTVWRLQRI